MTVQQQEMIEYTTQDVIRFLMEEYHLSMKQAMDTFYSSHIFEKLTNVNTGLYLQGSAYVYELLKEEGMRAYCAKSVE